MKPEMKKQRGRSTVSRLFGQLKGQRVRLSVVALSVIVYVGLSIYTPMFSATVIDHLWQSIQAAWKEGIPFSITWTNMGAELTQLSVQYLLTWIFYYLQSYLMANVAECLNLELRSQIARKLNRLPLSFFDRNKAGEILSRVTSDLDKIAEVLQTGLLKLIVAVGTIIGSLAVMFYYSAALTCIFLGFMLVSMIITQIVAKKNLRCAAERQETIGELTGIVEEYYNGRNVIKAYNHEEESIRQVAAATEKNRIANQKADFLTNCVNPLIRLLTRLANVVIAIIAGRAMLNGTMTVGVVQAFFQYVNQTAEPLTEASFMINSLQSALASAKRTFELLDEEEERPDPSHPAVLERAQGNIAFSHVSFGYPFSYVPVHIVKALGVGGKAADLYGGTAVNAWLGFQILLAEVIILYHIGISAIIVGFLCADGGFRVERGYRPCAAGVFPFRLGGQAVAIGTALPAHAGAVNGIGGGKSFLLAAGVAVCNRIQPGDIFHRQIFAGKAAGVIAHYILVFLLCHLIGAHIEITDRDRVLYFIIAPPGLAVRASHIKSPSGNQQKAFGHFNFFGDICAGGGLPLRPSGGL